MHPIDQMFNSTRIPYACLLSLLFIFAAGCLLLLLRLCHGHDSSYVKNLIKPNAKLLASDAAS